MKTITETLFIIALLIITGECFMVAFVVMYRTDKIINTLTMLIANLQVSALMPGNNKQISSASTKEVKGGKAVGNDNENKPKTTIKENNIQSAEYSGILHKFVRDGRKHERAVMTYIYKGEKVFFEYDETGKPVSINGKTKESVLRVLEGEKVRNFKLYEIENK